MKLENYGLRELISILHGCRTAEKKEMITFCHTCVTQPHQRRIGRVMYIRSEVGCCIAYFSCSIIYAWTLNGRQRFGCWGVLACTSMQDVGVGVGGVATGAGMVDRIPRTCSGR